MKNNYTNQSPVTIITIIIRLHIREIQSSCGTSRDKYRSHNIIDKVSFNYCQIVMGIYMHIFYTSLCSAKTVQFSYNHIYWRDQQC